MKKYITAAALLAAGNAFVSAAEFSLACEWDFSTAKIVNGSIVATNGSNLSIKLGEGQTISTNGALTFDGTNDYASIDVTSLNIGATANGDNASFKIVMELISRELTGVDILWSASRSGEDINENNYTTGIGLHGGNGTVMIMKNGSAYGTQNYDINTVTVSEENPLTIEAEYTSSGVVVSVSGNSTKLTSNGYTIDGENFSTIYLGNWSNKKSPLVMGLSKVQIYTTVPEPSAFGLLAGIGALALVASRRRRK